LGLGDLFEWAHPDAVRASRELQHKEPYLNIPFFWIRAGLYFVIWISVATVLNIWSRRQDRAAGPGLKRSLATLSGVGLVLLGITIHFASVDWLMSLQPRFRSTIIGPLWASGHLLSAQAFTLVVLAAVLRRSPLKDYVSPDALNDLGNLLLTFVVVWTYMAYFGYMLIWIANMQNEVIWFLPRSSGAWTVIAWLLVIFQAAVPFFALLVRDVKRSAPALALIGALLLVTDLVFNYFQVLPSFGAAGATTLWINFLPPLAIGGAWLADFLWELQRFPLVAINDPSRESALHLRRSEEENEHWAEVSHA
jgi:hypothetical protein